MSMLRIITLILSLVVPLVAQESQAPVGTPAEQAGSSPQGPSPAGSSQAVAGDHGHAKAKSTMEMGNSEFFLQQFGHTTPHAILQFQLSPDPKINRLFTFYDVNQYQVYSILLMLVVFMLVLGSFGAPQTPWIVRVFRGWCLWLRDEVIYSVMGKEQGKVFAPYFLYLFFFIAFGNLLGMIPGGVTMTATIYVTGALALVTFVMMVGGGMIQQGPGKYWLNLLPQGIPIWLIPLMAVLEVIGLIVKPFALTIRLFANMLAGHLVIGSFIGMIFLFAKMMDMGWLAWVAAVPSVGMAVFIFIIEAFVALLQAYIFTYLSIIFVQQSLHPAH